AGSPLPRSTRRCARRSGSWWSPATSAASGRARSRWTSRPRSSGRSASWGDRGAAERVGCAHMADPRVFQLEEILNRPGTYFNPQTEVLVVVDDSPELDSEIFNMEEFEGADWVLISDEVPVDENRRDELLETFQARHAPGELGELSEEEEEELEELD